MPENRPLFSERFLRDTASLRETAWEMRNAPDNHNRRSVDPLGSEPGRRTDHRDRQARPRCRHQRVVGGQKAVARPNTDRPDAHNPSTTGTASGAKLEEGANSFTEAQVRHRLDEAGFKDAKDLKKDDKGIWRGTAMMNGKAVPVGVDFKGNVAAPH